MPPAWQLAELYRVACNSKLGTANQTFGSLQQDAIKQSVLEHYSLPIRDRFASKRYRNQTVVAIEVWIGRVSINKHCTEDFVLMTKSVFELRCKMTLEGRLAQAYITLLVVSDDEHDLKSASVIRYGAYEVRLIEPPSSSDTFAFWIELFDHDCQSSIDGGGADDFERALATAEYLASYAKQLRKRHAEK